MHGDWNKAPIQSKSEIVPTLDGISLVIIQARVYNWLRKTSRAASVEFRQQASSLSKWNVCAHVVWQTFIHATVCARVKSGGGGGSDRACKLTASPSTAKLFLHFAWPKCQMMMMMMTTRANFLARFPASTHPEPAALLIFLLVFRLRQMKLLRAK